MLEEDRANFMNRIQKDMTRACYQKCANNKPCQQVCFKKYLKAVATANDQLRDIAYSRHSILAYKAYPESQIEHIWYHTNILLANIIQKLPYAVREDKVV